MPFVNQIPARRPAGRLLLRTAAAACAALTLAGCGLLGGDPAPRDTQDDPSAKPKPAADGHPLADHPDTTTTSVKVQRLGDDQVVAALTVANRGDETISVRGGFTMPHHNGGPSGWDYESFSGIGLYDPAERTMSYPYRVERGCLCTEVEDSNDQKVDPGEDLTLAGVLPAPESEAVDVHLTDTEPFFDVPVSPGKPDLAALGIKGDPGQEVSSGQAEPVSMELMARTEAKDKTQETIDDAEGTNINLSADVLFEVDKAELTKEADAVIADAAQRIQDSGVDRADIAGHADSSGDDAINDPLSKERAEAVQSALDEHIDTEVTFTAKGFGSKEPIASNDSEDGRRRNRRVTVTIPQDAKSEATPEASAAPDSGGGSSGGAGNPASEFDAVTHDDEDGSWKFHLTSLERDGEMAMLRYTITNTGSEAGMTYFPLSQKDDMQRFNGLPAAGVVLTADGSRYHTAGLRYPGAEDADRPWCACSQSRRFGTLDPDASRPGYSLVVLPPDVQTVDVQAGAFPAMDGVAVKG